MTIVYIHGFGGNGEGNKARLFREYFKSKNINFIAPSLSYIPILAIKTLQELIDSYKYLGEEVAIIGSSLGGYFGIYLACGNNIKAVLINPSVQPFNTLKKPIERGINYYDNSVFEWNSSYLKMLQELEVQELNPKNFMLLTQKADEVLDYSYAVKKLEGCVQHVEEGGDHSFEGIERYFEKISEFIKA
jgi:predicted esterase YcpF (UPF0227 family)